MTGQSKRPLKKFERTAGAMPALKRAAPAPTSDAGANVADADPLELPAVPGFLSQKEVLLRLVETLKSL